MTTFKASTSSGTRRTIGSGRPMTIADVAATVTDGPLPFRLTAFDGSSAGPADGPGLHINNRRALTYVLTAPGDLGLVRAYVSGDIDFINMHSADPYPLLKLMDDDLRLRRPSPGEVKDMVAGIGLKTLLPVAPPPQEAIPRWLRLAQGLGHSKKRDSSAISKHYDVSNAFYEYVLGPSMTYTCAVFQSAGLLARAGPGRQARPGLRQAGPAARPTPARRRLRLGSDGPACGPARRAGTRCHAVPATGRVGPKGHRRCGSAASRGDQIPGLPGCRRNRIRRRYRRSG